MINIFSGSCFWFHLDVVQSTSPSLVARIIFYFFSISIIFFHLFSYFSLIQSNEILGDVLLERNGGGKMFDALSGVWLFNHRQISSHVLFISKKGVPEREESLPQLPIFLALFDGFLFPMIVTDRLHIRRNLLILTRKNFFFFSFPIHLPRSGSHTVKLQPTPPPPSQNSATEFLSTSSSIFSY